MNLESENVCSLLENDEWVLFILPRDGQTMVAYRYEFNLCLNEVRSRDFRDRFAIYHVS